MKYVLINADNLYAIQQNFPWLSIWFDRIKIRDDQVTLQDRAFILDTEDKTFFKKVLISKILI